MTKVGELRIGNLVNVNNPEYHTRLTVKKTPLKIAGVCMGGNGYAIQLNTLDITKQYISPFISQYIKYLKPIPLTEEWLIKFGFEKKAGLFSVSIVQLGRRDWVFAIALDGSFGLYQNNDAFMRGSSFSIETRIKYVHQLQNLYFALTGEELELKEGDK